jgi:hypothetical protein
MWPKWKVNENGTATLILDDKKAIRAQRWGYVGWGLIIAAFLTGLAGVFFSWTLCTNGPCPT